MRTIEVTLIYQGSLRYRSPVGSGGKSGRGTMSQINLHTVLVRNRSTIVVVKTNTRDDDRRAGLNLRGRNNLLGVGIVIVGVDRELECCGSIKRVVCKIHRRGIGLCTSDKAKRI